MKTLKLDGFKKNERWIPIFAGVWIGLCFIFYWTDLSLFFKSVIDGSSRWSWLRHGIPLWIVGVVIGECSRENDLVFGLSLSVEKLLSCLALIITADGLSLVMMSFDNNWIDIFVPIYQSAIFIVVVLIYAASIYASLAAIILRYQEARRSELGTCLPGLENSRL